MSGVPGVPPAEELSALPAGELAARLAEAYRVIGELTARAGQLAARAEDLAAQNERLVSGYALASVIVEAAYQSGARMQARLALQHGRHVFLMRTLLEHDWARGYAQRPGVTVVGNADNVFEGLRRLAAESAESTELVWA